MMTRIANHALRVMKFGGTSVGDAAAIERVAGIVVSAACERQVVVVVSAMSGVTNQLVAAATHSEAGDEDAAAVILDQLRRRHTDTLGELVSSPAERARIQPAIKRLLEFCSGLCCVAISGHSLPPNTRDAIVSLGERLSILLVAAALAERGLRCEAIEATELVVTDANHGAADPLTEPTRFRCQHRLLPLLRRNVIPVVTGFLGATADGVLTTLGRGGSDYSATILGAALDADEVEIWTDVDGLETADPRRVPGARTIAEVSYSEAAELAYFGANVLHPKTLRPLMQRGIPLWIRNSFAAERPGTRITHAELAHEPGIHALAVLPEVAVLTAAGADQCARSEALRRIAAAVPASIGILMISQNEYCLVLPRAAVPHAMEIIQAELHHSLQSGSALRLDCRAEVALLTVAGRALQSIPGIAVEARRMLAESSVAVLAQNLSASTLCFAIAKKDVDAALCSLHAGFGLADPVLENADHIEAVSLSLRYARKQPSSGHELQPVASNGSPTA
jgi:aspartate kinase